MFMDLVKLEDSLAQHGAASHYLLETFILEILKIEAKSLGQVVDIEKPSRAGPDAFAPHGIGPISQPASIEIVRTLRPSRIKYLLDSFITKKRDESEILLIISLDRGVNPDLLSDALAKTAEIKLLIWGPKEIQKIIDKHSDIANKLAQNLFSARLQLAISHSTQDWKIDRDRVVASVTEKYVAGRFALMLGAGVSSSAGIPDWNTLLNSLFVSMLTDENLTENSESDHVSSIVKRLRQMDGPSALMLARYIRKGLSAGSSTEQKEFIQAVTSQLYTLRDKRFSLRSPLIKELANLCAPTRTGAKVQSVITYNFDDLIERELEERGLLHKTIFEEVELAAPEELPIYHVHGFLPEDRSKHLGLERSTLVFSEEGYHQIYSQAYHWSNLIQLASLKESTCLMIGLSLTDPNLRRLLEISAKSIEKPKHFAFLPRLGLDKFTKDDDGKNLLRAPISIAKRFLDRHHSLNEEVMRELGVNVIWYENHDEIPVILQKIGKGRAFSSNSATSAAQ